MMSNTTTGNTEIVDQAVTITASQLPVKTFRWLQVNDTKIKLPAKITNQSIDMSVLPQGCKFIEVSESDHFDRNRYPKDMIEKLKQAEGAIGKEFYDWISKQTERYTILVIDNAQSRDMNHSINLHFSIGPGETSAKHFGIYVTEGSSADIILNAEGGDCKSLLAIMIQGYLEKDARLIVNQVQMLNDQAKFLSDLGTVQEENSQLTLIRADLGAEQSWIGVKTNLLEKSASFHSELAYLESKHQRLDVNDIVLHKGKKTISQLNSTGVLADQAEKTYKGTIDLQRGCAGAKGQEMESVLLLSDDVVNKTVPLILCSEEDVEGNHGATIGKIDEETLNYMESRGIDAFHANLLIVHGRLNQILQRIPDAELIEKSGRFIKEALKDEQ